MFSLANDVDLHISEMNRPRQLTGHLNNRRLTRFAVGLRLFGNRLCIHVIAFCQRVAGVQLPDWAAIPYTRSDKTIRNRLSQQAVFMM